MTTLQIFTDFRVFLLDKGKLIAYELVGEFATNEDYLFLVKRGKQLYKVAYTYESDCDGSYWNVSIEKTYIRVSTQNIEFVQGDNYEKELNRIFRRMEYDLLPR